MSYKRFQELRVYQLAERLADDIWKIVDGWESVPKNTVGIQIIRSADSIGANIAEGVGRGSYQDNRRFVKMARGSLNETLHWLRRAYNRKLLTEEQINTLKLLINDLEPQLNAYLKSIGRTPKDESLITNIALPTLVRYSKKELTADRRGWTLS
ncbi:MAG: four helix bundle protein [Nostocaceae cyanobacterium]|nr:four helix bundle protein [Nostocaceae cyanobacterium]